MKKKLEKMQLKERLIYSGFSLFAYSNDDSRTDVIQMVKEYGGIEYEINLSEKEKGWYYVTAKVGE